MHCREQFYFGQRTGWRRKPLLRAQTFPRDAPALPHPRTLPEGMRLEGSELKGPVPAQPLQPTFSTHACGSLKGIKLLPYLFSHQINDSEIPNSKAGLPRVLRTNGTNPPSLRCTVIQGNFSSLPSSLLLALEEPQKLCFNPWPAAFPEPPQSHPTFSSHLEVPQSKPPGQREVMLLQGWDYRGHLFTASFPRSPGQFEMPIKKEKHNDGKTPRREKERGKGEKSPRAAQCRACASTNSKDVAGDRNPTAQNSLVGDPAALSCILPSFFATRRSRKVRDGNTKLSHMGVLLAPGVALCCWRWDGTGSGSSWSSGSSGGCDPLKP